MIKIKSNPIVEIERNPVIKLELLSAKARGIAMAVGSVGLLLVGMVLGFAIANIPVDTKESTKQLSLNLEPSNDATPIKHLQAKEMFTWQPKNLSKEIECLAKNMYFEARNQEVKGKVAVGLVTINRVKSPKYPDTVCDVVWQKRKHPQTGKYVAQFSWTWDGKPDEPKNQTKWEQCKRIAEAMLAERSLDNFYDFTKQSTHYHAVYVKPYWRKKMTKISVIGAHIFYRDEKAVAFRNMYDI